MESRSDSDCARTSGELRISALEESRTAFSESCGEASGASAREYTDSAGCKLQCIRAHESGQHGAHESGQHDCRISSAELGRDSARFQSWRFGGNREFTGERDGTTVVCGYIGARCRNRRTLWWFQPGGCGGTGGFFELCARGYSLYNCWIWGEPERSDPERHRSCEYSCGSTAKCANQVRQLF